MVNHAFHFSWSEWSVPWLTGAVSDDDGDGDGVLSVNSKSFFIVN